MFKDVVGRLSAAFQAEKTARMPAAVMVQVEGRQARSKAPESVFAGNRATALQLARSVVPVLKGDQAKKMADKVMVRQIGELEASHPSSPIPSWQLVSGPAESPYAPAGATERWYQRTRDHRLVVAEPFREGHSAGRLGGAE
jgi:hypothetical protein